MSNIMKKVRAKLNLTDSQTGDYIGKGSEFEVSNKRAKKLKDLNLVEYVKVEKKEKEDKSIYTTKEEKNEINTK